MEVLLLVEVVVIVVSVIPSGLVMITRSDGRTITNIKRTILFLLQAPEKRARSGSPIKSPLRRSGMMATETEENLENLSARKVVVVAVVAVVVVVVVVVVVGGGRLCCGTSQ